ncbi:MAG: ABC transporter ATP-binding protein [Planctomycetota bacterium]
MESTNDQLERKRDPEDQRRVDDGARTLDQVIRDRMGIERTTVLRSFHQVAARSDGLVTETWWQLLADAAATLQLRPAVMDCSVQQVIRLASDGADVVLFSMPEDGNTASEGLGKRAAKKKSAKAVKRGWIILRRSGKRLEWWRASDGRTIEKKASSKLRAELANMAVDQRIRCVAFDWRETSVQGASSPNQAMRPLQRVQHLLRAEWSDIYLVIVFAFVLGLLTLATPIAVESLVNTVAFGRFIQPIVVLAILLLTFLGFNAAVKALQTYIVEIIQQRLFARVAGDLAHRLPRISVQANERTYLPELANRFFDVVTVQKVSAFLLLDGVSLVLSVAIGMAVLGFYHPFLLGFDALLLAAMVFLIVVLGRNAVKTAIKESKSKYYIAAWLEDVARAQTTFTSAAGKSLSVSRADRLVHDYLVHRKKHFRVLFRQILFALALQAIASTVLLGLGGYLVVIGELTLGQLVAAELIVAVIVGAFTKMGKHLESFYDLCASVDKLGALFDLPLARQGTILQSMDSTPPKVELESIGYSRSDSYEGLRGISVVVPSASSLAIVGPSGSGKSTLIDLMYGHRRPSSGHVKVDGNHPTDLQSDDFWNHVELVRDGEIFAGTLEENIHLQRNDISGKDVDRALEIVGLQDYVSHLRDGLRTPISSHGSPLSASRIRLLLLARAIAAKPSLILVDGVLDSLPDEECQRMIEHLTAVDRSWTLVVTTGRESIADACDRTLELPTGKLLTRDSASLT